MKLGEIIGADRGDGSRPLDGVRILAIEQMQALPYATLCIDCQRELEKHGGANVQGADLAHLLESMSNDKASKVNDIEMDVS